MSKVYFLIKTTVSDANKEVFIRVRYKAESIDQATSTGEKVKLMYWNTNSQEFNRKNFKGKEAIKARLRALETHILEEAIKAKEIVNGWLVDVVDRYLHPEKYEVTGLSMFEWIDSWIKNSKSVDRVIKNYTMVKKEIQELRPGLRWDDINMVFYDNYVESLTKKGLAKNTIGDHIKHLKTFCNAAYLRGEHTNITFKRFKKPNEESFNVYLDEEELDALFKLDLSKSPYLERVRDVFLVGCWTGCRFSDIAKVCSENIKGEIVTLEQEKTKTLVKIPLHPVVKTILEKYNGKLPEMITNQKFNEFLKQVVKRAQIEDKVIKGITKGGKRESKEYKKWQLISSHSARRSFATNLYKSGFPSFSIMKITGHKTETSFLKYIKVSEEEVAIQLAKHWGK